MTTLEGLILLIVWLLWAAALFGGYATGHMNAAGTHRIPTRNRMTSSALLVVAGALYAAFIGEGVLILIAAGMAFGLLGDLFMAKLIVQGEARVLGGMASFGVGHILYIIALLTLAGTVDAPADARTVAWVLWLIIGAVLWYVLIFRRARERGTLHLAALPYALLLASTTGVATGLALGEAAFGVAALGAFLFLLSDLVLAMELFNGFTLRGIGDLVWLTYGPGQMLIVYGAALARVV